MTVLLTYKPHDLKSRFKHRITEDVFSGLETAVDVTFEDTLILRLEKLYRKLKSLTVSPKFCVETTESELKCSFVSTCAAGSPVVEAL